MLRTFLRDFVNGQIQILDDVDESSVSSFENIPAQDEGNESDTTFYSIASR
jgi:hypothetical protein